MRQLILSPRWIVWHLLTLGAMVTCGWLAVWQWERAGSSMGSALNVGYGLQWPLFALFFAGMWWRLLRMEATKSAEAGADAARTDAASEVAPEDVTSDATPEDARSDDSAAVPTGPPQAVAEGPSPFGPRPASVRVAPVTEEDDPELAAYNRMLAALAARDAVG